MYPGISLLLTKTNSNTQINKRIIWVYKNEFTLNYEDKISYIYMQMQTITNIKYYIYIFMHVNIHYVYMYKYILM